MTKLYNSLFENPNYNKHSTNTLRYKYALDFLKFNHSDSNLIDIGSGRGTFLKLIIKRMPNIKITSADLEKFHPLNVDFVKIDLNKVITLKTKYDVLTCLDVIEHLKKESLNQVFDFFKKSSNYQFVSIANHPDIQNGKDVHLIQENLNYWIPVLEQHFNIKNLIIKKFLHMPNEIEDTRFNYAYFFELESKKNDVNFKTPLFYQLDYLSDSFYIFFLKKYRHLKKRLKKIIYK